MSRDSFFKQWSDLHGGVEVSGFVKGWLTLSFVIVKPLHALRITPNILTCLGLVAGIFTWLFAKSTAGLLFLLLSLFLDGLDGSLAIVSSRTSKWGAHLDSTVDRAVEFFWALTFIAIGAPVVLIGFALCAALSQEYARARSGGLGHRSIDVVTLAERPVRAILLALSMAAVHLASGSAVLIKFFAILWLLLQSQALVVVLRDSYSALRTNNIFGD